MRYQRIYNEKFLRVYRRELRNRPTIAELRMWKYIRKRQINNCRFLRQYGVGPYILDFYCPKLKLAIEIDGDYHGIEDVIEYDKIRTEFLKSTGIRVLRFWNLQVRDDIEGILKTIKHHLNLPP